MDIAAWLKALDLGRYSAAFEANDIDLAVLRTLNGDDLRELGVTSLGHRKKLLEAIAALGAPTPASAGAREAERRQLTVMFCDLVGSTALSAKLDPEDMREVIRAYQNAVVCQINLFEGHVAKYMGDGVLAYFGWPLAHEDDAERSVRAGLALVDAVAKLKVASGDSLSARVSIATGLVVVGDLVGEGAAQEHAVVGDTPNLAARLEGMAQPGQVVISEITRRLLGAGFELDDLGLPALKGLAEPVAAFAVCGERAAESRFEARSAQVLPMVGRDQELALLLERWTQAQEGEGQGVLLVGEAGIGKSRITRALLDALADEPHTRIRYQCSPYHTDSALWPVIQQLGHAAGLGAADGPELKLDKLEALLGQADGRDAAPLIADLVGLDGSARYGPLDLTPQTQRARTLAVLVDQLLGLATKEPVLVVLEDAHWIDPTTLELIEQSLDRIENARVLILLTTRPDHLPALAAHPHVTRLTLNRLGRTGVKAIVERLGGSRLPTDTIDAITARTDGVPLFVEELTKAMLATGEGTIPASLHDSLMARLDRIPEVKEVAQIAACLGREFDFALLALVADRTEGDLGVALDQLVAGELIFRRGTPPEATYSFKHALVCDAAYQSLLKRRRQVVHARVATVLSKQPYDGGATNPEVLAHHFTEAGLPDEALPYWLKAGEQATARFALAEAIGHLTKGLELVESMPEAPERASFELALLIALGPPLMISKGLYAPEVERLYARANGRAQQIGGPAQRFATLWGLWHLTHGRADFRSARSLADELLTLAEGQNDPEQLLEAHHAEWTTCFFRGELVSAAPHLAAGCALYEPKAHRSHAFLYGGHDPGTCCRIMNAMILALRGYPEQAIAEGQTALRLAHELDNPPNLAYAQCFGAHLHQFLRDGPALVRQAEKGMLLASAQGMRPFAKVAELLHGWARMECGEVDEGAAQVHGVLARARARKKPTVMMAYYLTLLADACARTGDQREGLAILADAFEMMEIADERLWEAELHRLKGELLLKDDSTERTRAERSFRQGIAVAQRQEARLLELRASTSLARLWHDRGKTSDARDLLAPIYAWFEEGFDAADLKDAKALLEALR